VAIANLVVLRDASAHELHTVVAGDSLSSPRVRAPVDVVVPFAGAEAELQALRTRLRGLALRPEDTLVVVDNRENAGTAVALDGVLPAPELRSSYHARNRGAGQGQAPWLLFLDADVIAPPDLLDRYFERPAGERTAVLAGAIRDIPPTGGGRLARRYARLTEPLNDENTWRPGFAYAQTANAMVRRSAFEAVGGFAEVRGGGDADLCFRLTAQGWAIERRREAVVEHRSRASLRGLVRQHLRYGAGAEWLEGRYPGFAPQRRGARIAVTFARGQLQAARALVRRDPDDAVRLALDATCRCAFEFGRGISNEPDHG
jgi:GT2 family glycosyltransferase